MGCISDAQRCISRIQPLATLHEWDAQVYVWGGASMWEPYGGRQQRTCTLSQFTFALLMPA